MCYCSVYLVLLICHIYLLINAMCHQLYSQLPFIASGHYRHLKLVSLLASSRVRNNGRKFQSNICDSLPGIMSCCRYYRVVRYSGVSARRDLTLLPKWVCWSCSRQGELGKIGGQCLLEWRALQTRS